MAAEAAAGHAIAADDHVDVGLPDTAGGQRVDGVGLHREPCRIAAWLRGVAVGARQAIRDAVRRGALHRGIDQHAANVAAQVAARTVEQAVEEHAVVGRHEPVGRLVVVVADQAPVEHVVVEAAVRVEEHAAVGQYRAVDVQIARHACGQRQRAGPVARGRQRRGGGRGRLARIGQAVEHEGVVRADGVAREHPDAVGHVVGVEAQHRYARLLRTAVAARSLVARQVHRHRIQRRVLRARRGRALHVAAAHPAGQHAALRHREDPLATEYARTPVGASDQVGSGRIVVELAVVQLERSGRAGGRCRSRRAGVVAADEHRLARGCAGRGRATQRDARGKLAVLHREVGHPRSLHGRYVGAQQAIESVVSGGTRGAARKIELTAFAILAAVDEADHRALRCARAHRALPEATGILLRTGRRPHVVAPGSAAAARDQHGQAQGKQRMGADKGGKTHGIGLGKEKAAPTPPGSNRRATICIAAAHRPDYAISTTVSVD